MKRGLSFAKQWQWSNPSFSDIEFREGEGEDSGSTMGASRQIKQSRLTGRHTEDNSSQPVHSSKELLHWLNPPQQSALLRTCISDINKYIFLKLKIIWILSSFSTLLQIGGIYVWFVSFALLGIADASVQVEKGWKGLKKQSWREWAASDVTRGGQQKINDIQSIQRLCYSYPLNE